MRTPEELKRFIDRKAAIMRANPTAAELKLWELLSPLGGWEFEKPVLIPKLRASTGVYPYILDFYHEGARLIVEVDGSSHRLKKGRDARRDERARIMLGALTMRIANKDVFSRPEWCLDQIRAMVESRVT